MQSEADDEQGADVTPSTNYETFRECLSEIVIQQLAPVTTTAKGRKRTSRTSRKKGALGFDKVQQSPSDEPKTNDAEDLGDFIEYLANEIFYTLPPELQGLTYASVRNDDALAAAYTPPLPKSTLEKVATFLPSTTIDSLSVYGLVADPEELQRAFIEPLLTSYTNAATAPPPSVSTLNRASACEICERDWIPLTYHHLIPRSTHARVLKRGWHEEWQLNSVAWLCRACHSMVHRLESNEELARNYYSVERLLERDEVRKFATWVGGVRWKAR